MRAEGRHWAVSVSFDSERDMTTEPTLVSRAKILVMMVSTFCGS
jgi:hypothetical protein